MNTFTPNFPPALLEKCLDFSRYIAEKTGKATFEINLGNSRFFFSADNCHQSPAGAASRGPGRASNRGPFKRKSPSDRKRDALRKEKFLDRKRNSSPPGAPYESSDLPNPPVDSAMESTSPVKEPPNAGKSAAMDTTENSTPLDLPPVISPINTPEKIQSEEVKIMLCASNQIATSNVIKKFPLSVYEGPTRNKNHFIFSANFSPSQIKTLKKDSLKIIKPPNDVHIVNYFIVNEEEVYYPEDKKHCPGCLIFN